MDSLEALLNLIKNGAAPWIVLAAWAMKELFSFLIRWKKADAEANAQAALAVKASQESSVYKPDDQWRQYCTSKFDSIIEGLGEVRAEVKVLESQQQTIRLQVSRIESDIRGGKNNGKH